MFCFPTKKKASKSKAGDDNEVVFNVIYTGNRERAEKMSRNLVWR